MLFQSSVADFLRLFPPCCYTFIPNFFLQVKIAQNKYITDKFKSLLLEILFNTVTSSQGDEPRL